MGADSAGPAIGIIPNAQFKTTEAKLAPGDCLLFYTDGIIEVEASDGSQFGIEGLSKAFAPILISRRSLCSMPSSVTFANLAIPQS